MTKTQIDEYNRKTGKSFKFQKGIHWYPVVFFKKDTKEISRKEIERLFPDCNLNAVGAGESIGTDGRYVYFYDGENFYKQRNILRYSNVCERNFVKDEDGNMIESNFEDKKIDISRSDLIDLVNKYLDNCGIRKNTYTTGCMSYNFIEDSVQINEAVFSEGEYWSGVFHELAHSTGNRKRLNRKLSGFRDEDYSKEECIAEICSAMLCERFGLAFNEVDHTTSLFDNSISYIQYWKERIKDWGKEFIWICSQAQEACDFILKNMGIEE